MTAREHSDLRVLVLGAAILAAGLLPVPACAPRTAAASADDAAKTASPILVELFTSQGCSSCPPADRYLRELRARPDLQGVILALSFHVDYWNRLGWRDPFSQAAWSDRQRRYARLLENGRVYTPNIVVDGRFSCVGSDRECVEAALEKALLQAERRAREKSVSLVVHSARPRPGVLQIVATSAWQAESVGRADLSIVVAESGLETEVERGENARRRLANDGVVRELQVVASLGPGGDSDACVFREIDLPPDWNPQELQVIVLVQQPASKRVLATSSVAVPTHVEASTRLAEICTGPS